MDLTLYICSLFVLPSQVLCRSLFHKTSFHPIVFNPKLPCQALLIGTIHPSCGGGCQRQSEFCLALQALNKHQVGNASENTLVISTRASLSKGNNNPIVNWGLCEFPVSFWKLIQGPIFSQEICSHVLTKPDPGLKTCPFPPSPWHGLPLNAHFLPNFYSVFFGGIP